MNQDGKKKNITGNCKRVVNTESSVCKKRVTCKKKQGDFNFAL
jgi:hypothetical protein